MSDQLTVMTANTAPDTITAVAIACWQQDHDDEDCPADMIPSIVEHGELRVLRNPTRIHVRERSEPKIMGATGG